MILAIFLTALLSFASYFYCWSDIRAGRPHAISLRQITLIMDRKVLSKWFGEPQAGFHYALSPWQRTAFIRARRPYVMMEMTADMLCMVGAARFLIGVAFPAFEEWFILLAGLCQGINVVYSMWLVWKWGDQIREEIEDIGE